jgi:hypothetical protein
VSDDREIKVGGIRMNVIEAKDQRRVYQHLKDQGESEAAEMIKSLSIRVGEARAETHKATGLIVELYRQNALLGEALACKTLGRTDITDQAAAKLRSFIDKLGDVVDDADVRVTPVSEKELEEIKSRRAAAETAASTEATAAAST